MNTILLFVIAVVLIFILTDLRTIAHNQGVILKTLEMQVIQLGKLIEQGLTKD